MDGFTLQRLAFPVAPATLPGFTLDGFAWLDLEPTAPPALRAVTLTAADLSRVSLRAADASAVTLTASAKD